MQSRRVQWTSVRSARSSPTSVQAESVTERETESAEESKRMRASEDGTGQFLDAPLRNHCVMRFQTIQVEKSRQRQRLQTEKRLDGGWNL